MRAALSYLDSKSNVLVPQRAFANILASQTDNALVAAPANLASGAAQTIRVLWVNVLSAGTATNVTFNTKPAGAGVAITPLYPLGINGGFVFPWNNDGWFETTAGQGLTVTTGAGATVAVMIGFVVCPQPNPTFP